MTDKVAIFPGSFDPFTNGHKEVVLDALKLFNKLIIAIGINGSKRCLFTPEQRQQMIEQVFSGANVQVMIFSGLIADFAQTVGASVLVRGLRTESDFAYEMPMAITNRILANHLQTVFLPTSQESHYLSSTLVREVVSHGGDISAFVPAAVLKHFKS